MSPAASGSPMLGAEHEWADIQARWGYSNYQRGAVSELMVVEFIGLSVDGMSVLELPE